MTPRQKRIKELDDNNAEFAKEILLNESAIYAAEKEINMIESEVLSFRKVQSRVKLLKLIIDRLKVKNDAYRQNIYQNNFEIKLLENESD